MKILFIATQVEMINSSAAIRNCTLINGLHELGHEVHVHTIEYPAVYTSTYLKDNLQAANVVRTQLPIYKFNQSVESQGILKRASLLREFLKKVRSFVFFPDMSITWLKSYDYSKLDSDYDLMISSSDSKVSHLLAEKVQKKLGIKWVQVWGDPWFDDFTMSKFTQLRAKRHESRLLSKADNVVYVSKATHSKQQSLFVKNAEKMNYVPRGFMKTVETENTIKDNQIRISYTGNLFWGRNVSSLIEALKKFNETSEVKFVLDIYGVKDEKFLEMSREYEFINIYAPVDYAQILQVYEKSNILLFISNSSTSTQIPGKFFDYSGTTRPMLCLMNDDECQIARYLKSFDRCLVIKNDEAVISENMSRMMEMASHTYEIPASFYPKEVATQIIDKL